MVIIVYTEQLALISSPTIKSGKIGPNNLSSNLYTTTYGLASGGYNATMSAGQIILMNSALIQMNAPDSFYNALPEQTKINDFYQWTDTDSVTMCGALVAGGLMVDTSFVSTVVGVQNPYSLIGVLVSICAIAIVSKIYIMNSTVVGRYNRPLIALVCGSGFSNYGDRDSDSTTNRLWLDEDNKMAHLCITDGEKILTTVKGQN